MQEFIRPGAHFLARPITARLGAFFAAALLAASAAAQAAEDDEEQNLEEVIVVGSQIKGANITGALAVSVISADDIELMGVDSGDELLSLIPENGQNFFNEAENISGGVNSARGDIGAFNMRNIGTGNTLVLLNGRRLVNAAGFQTEEVGGSFVPVNTVNSQILPVWGIERVEVLRDGASAIYGADAVAGVVNTVLKDDLEGFNIRLRYTDFSNLPSTRTGVTGEWGRNFNDGRTNVGVFFNYYQRDRISSVDDERWSNSDFRDRIPEGSRWEGDTRFRNNTTNSIFGQFDVISSVAATHSLRVNKVVDNAGEFEVYPAGDDRCAYRINDVVCGAPDGQGTVRHNYNSALDIGRDLASELQRTSLFVNINHELENGMESFTELLFYQSNSNLNRHASASFSSVKLEIGANNYYNPFGPCGSANRLPDSVIGDDVPCSGLKLLVDNYRFTEVPRVVDVDGRTYRLLQGLRGSVNEWDWEAAFSHAGATKSDVTRNRVSNTLMQEALNDSTAAAYNHFSGGKGGSNIERALVDVSRDSSTDLTTFDVSFSNNNLAALPTGPMGGLVGLEWRREAFEDDRDPRLDGTIVFTDRDGDTYPYVSDVVNSSPTPDGSGERTVISVFGELQIPVIENLDAQVALRYEGFSDIPENAIVGKVAVGYRPIDQVLVRGSWSQAFRAPNLVTVNEEVVARSNTRTDWACEYANDETDGKYDLDCSNSTQRVARGSKDLVPEQSTNLSVGFALEPVDGLTFTFDYWQIEKDDTIGLFGEENHMLLDLLYRIEAGTGNCSTTFNSAVVREEDPDDDYTNAFTEAGLCPAGAVIRVEDMYANLDKRTLAGFDVGVYLDVDTSFGALRFSYNGAFLTKFDQEASGLSSTLVAAQDAGTLPADYPIDGFADLLGRDGNQEQRQSMRLSWRLNEFGAALSMYEVGSFYQSSLTLTEDGKEYQYEIPAMRTFDLTFDYRTQISTVDTRVRLGIKNLADERAPLADRFFGYFADAHTDYGRSIYLDLRVGF